MNNETLSTMREIENESTGDVTMVGDVINVSEKLDNLNVVEKAQKLEHAEREMRLKEAQQRLEDEKFEYQKEQSKKDNLVKLGVAFLAALGAIITGCAKAVQVHKQQQYVHELYNIEQLTTIASGTGRALTKDGAMPRI